MDNYYTMQMDKLYLISLTNNQANKIYKKRIQEIRKHINYCESDDSHGIMYNFNKTGIHCVHHNDYYKNTKQMGI